MQNEQYVDFSNKVTVYNLEDDSFVDGIFNKDLSVGDCVGRLMCPWGGEPHGAGQACVDADRGNLYLDTSVCGGPGGGGTVPGGGVTGPGGPGHDFGGNNPGNGNDPQTSQGGGGTSNPPVMVPIVRHSTQPWEKIRDCVPDMFRIPGAIKWLQDHKGSAGQMSDYLEDNECSEEASEFSEMAVEAIMEGGEVDFPNRVILDSTFVNNVQLKCVYDKLTKDINPLFRNTVGTFIDDPEFNLTFRVGDCPKTDDQCTDDNDPYNIVITFEDVDTNSIEMAQAILHESIHAEIARFVEQFQTGVDVNNRPYLFQLYAYYKDYTDLVDPDFNWSNAADHQFMVNSYINNIAQALREFDNNRFPLDNYKDYAWDGLRKYGYDSGHLSEQEEDYNVNLRVQTNQNIQVCD